MQIVLERGSIDAQRCFQSKCSNISAEGLHFSAFHCLVCVCVCVCVCLSVCMYVCSNTLF